MHTIHAGGAEIPSLGLGTWQLRGTTCARRVADALAIGYRHLDTAQMYGNHEAVGAGMRRAGVPREEIFLTSKLWLDSLGASAVAAGTEQALRELGTDYLDLLLIHWPNPDVPLGETLDAMRAQCQQGRVRHLGVSNFPPSWLEKAVSAAPIVCNQVEYHPFLSQQHLLDPVRTRGMALVAYSPLAHGRVHEHAVLQELADRHGRSPAQVALRWLLSQPQVAAIPKASRREHLEENFDVFGFTLSQEEMARLHALAEDEGARTVDPEFAPRWERPGGR